MVNATDVLQPSMLIVLTLFPPHLDVPTFTNICPHDARDPGSERWSYVGEN
jgi:hypothetical protein